MFIVTHSSLQQRVKKLRVDMHRDARGWMHDGGIAPLTFPKGATGTKVPFYNSIIGNFMVDQDRPETILLQLFGHSEKSE